MSKNTDLAGYDTNLPVANLTATGTISVGSNVVVNTSTIFVGNSTVNSVVNSSSITIGSVTHNSSVISIGSNVVVNTSAITIGNSTVNAIVNSSTVAIGSVVQNSSAIIVGSNVVVNTSTIFVGNSTVNTIYSASGFSINGDIGGIIPTGGITQFGTSFNSNTFLQCNGNSYSQSTYANLYNAIGNSYTLTSNLHINGQPWRQQYFFNVQNNGTLGTWSTYGTSLPGTLSYSQAIVTNGYVYLLGGNNGSSIVSTVYYAPINSNGTLGTWSTGTSLPGALGYSQAIVTNGYVYLLGGYNGSSYTSTIYYAPINSNGTLGTWSTYGTSLPGALGISQAIVTNGYVYLLGGDNGSSWVSTVYYAPINSNGTLGTWSTGTSLPGVLGNSQAIVTNGYVYLLGGYNGSSYTSTIYYISFNGGLNNYLNNIYLPGSNSSYFNVPYYPPVNLSNFGNAPALFNYIKT